MNSNEFATAWSSMLNARGDLDPADEIEAVMVELPWTPLVLAQGVRLSQVVLRQYAAAVEEAIDLYMECRPLALLAPAMLEQLTEQIWRVLQAAHPHPLWQWWDWDEAYQQFHQTAKAFLAAARAA